MAAVNIPKVVSFEQLERVAECARRLLYIRALDKAPFDEEFLPLSWFVENHSKGDYQRLLEVWDSGLESMRGKTLIARCIDIIANTALEPPMPAPSHLSVVK